MSYPPRTDWAGIIKMLLAYIIVPGLVLLFLAILGSGTPLAFAPMEMLTAVSLVVTSLLAIAVPAALSVWLARAFQRTWVGWVAFALGFVVIGVPIYMGAEHLPGVGPRIEQIRSSD